MNTSSKCFKEASILSLEGATQNGGIVSGEAILGYKWSESLHHSLEMNGRNIYRGIKLVPDTVLSILSILYH